MDYENLHADVNLWLDKHYTPGRVGIQKVVLHYNDGDLSVGGCYSVWQTRAASAHYQVESSGRVGQLVHDGDTAWAVGNWYWNQRTISIEHANQGNWITDACLESGAHLTAAICKYYKLGRPNWGTNVIGHSDIVSTSCPGPLKVGGPRHDAYMRRAQEWYDAMVGGTAAPAPAPTPAPAPAPSNPSDGSPEHTGTGFGGTYTCMVDSLRVRTAPSLSSDTVAQYHKGQTVTLQDWYKIADGYVWGRYVGGSGNTRYIAVGKPTGGVSSDDFLVKGGHASGGSSGSSNPGFRAGNHTVTASAGVNVRKGPGTNYAVSGTLPHGYTINFDGTTAQGSGYIWARYVNNNGYYRWIATKYLS